MPQPPSDAYTHLVGLIGAPDVTVPIGLVELETVRRLLARVPGYSGRAPLGTGALSERAYLLMRDLDHRAGAILEAVDGAADEARIPIAGDELELLHEALAAYGASLHGIDPTPERYTTLVSTLDRRRGAEQYRQTRTSDPGE